MGSSKTRRNRWKAAKENGTQVRKLTDLERKQAQWLAIAREALSFRSRTLSPDSVGYSARCWEYFDKFQHEARSIGVLDEFRHLVFDSAGRFADPRMLRSGQRYYKYGPPDSMLDEYPITEIVEVPAPAPGSDGTVDVNANGTATSTGRRKSKV